MAESRRSTGVTPRLSTAEAEGLLTLTLAGRLDASGTGRIWKETVRAVRASRAVRVVLDAAAVSYCDGVGTALLIDVMRVARARGAEVRVEGLRDEFQTLLDELPPEDFEEQEGGSSHAPMVEEVGRRTVRVFADIRDQVSFLGEVCVRIAGVVVRPSRMRWGDFLRVIESVGAEALPIVSLMGALIGLIIAFQSADGMKQFGAELYAADALAISVVRELGPIMTAIILAGRSGSRFARTRVGFLRSREHEAAVRNLRPSAAPTPAPGQLGVNP